jgi:TetR/AcrR family transcriptional repressor of nem operon
MLKDEVISMGQEAPDTADRMLDVAERLVQTVGFNGFSYADIAAELEITKASLHYHFATKAALGAKLVSRYHENFVAALERIRRAPSDVPHKLRDYTALYSGVLRKNRMCLCGMLASDFATLPKPMQKGVREFFDANESWLAAILEEGRAAKTLAYAGPAAVIAQMIVSSLEGAMMVARSFNDVARFDTAATRLLDGLVAAKHR